jgi:hypothetical protein
MVISLEVPIGGPSIHGRTEHALRMEHAPEEQWFAGGLIRLHSLRVIRET